MSYLEIHKVRKRFRGCDFAHLDDVSLNVSKNTVVSLFGRNGSGKSTFFKILFGTMKAQRAEISIDDEVYIASQNIIDRQISYLPQAGFLPRHLRVRNAILCFFQDQEEMNKIFHAPKIAEIDKKIIGDLSEGQRKYLELLLVLNLPHPITLLDEPFSMVEPLYKEVIKDLILKVANEKTIIISDHYFQDVLEIAAENYVLSNGKIKKVDGIKELRDFAYLPA